MDEEGDERRARKEKTGVYDREYPDKAFLEALAQDDFWTTREVAERVECSYETAYRRLNELTNQDTVERKQFGNSYAWRLAQ